MGAVVALSDRGPSELFERMRARRGWTAAMQVRGVGASAALHYAGERLIQAGLLPRG